MKKRLVSLLVVTVMLMTMLAACSEKEDNNETTVSKDSAKETTKAEEDTKAEEGNTEASLTGTIIVLTNKTDEVDKSFVEYAKKFSEKYPGAKVEFEAMADYQGAVTTRLSTGDYGDALLIPATIEKKDIPDFFESLGDYESLSKTYRFLEAYTIDGNVYGIPTGGNIEGVIYNQRVFDEAGITEQARTIDEFKEQLQAIKDNTDAIPMYTNYADTWPLYPWARDLTSVSYYGRGDWGAAILESGSPFGQENGFAYTSLELLKDVVLEGLSEEDPTTSSWDLSKQLMGENKVGTMVLGSWAVSQIRDYSETPEDIKMMPFPIEVDGELHVNTTPDWMYGVSKHSENKELAAAWCHFFATESGYVEAEGFVSPLLEAEPPNYFADGYDFTLTSSIFLEGEASEKFDSIQSDSLINLYDQVWVKKIVEIGMGNASETFEEYMADLDKKWKQAAE